MSHLDLAGPLPSGRTAVEASAGTGKTHAIATLVTRIVAEGVARLPEILVVTFTRAATAELRGRVHLHLAEAHRQLQRTRAGGARPGDEVLALLAEGDAETVDERIARIENALGEFDSASISTIHGFCQDALTTAGWAANVHPDAELLEDVSDLVAATTSDVLVTAFSDEASTRPGDAELQEIVRQLQSNPTARIVPAAGQGAQAEGDSRALFARAHRTRLADNKRRDGVLTFNDLLLEILTALTDPNQRATVLGALRQRYRMALIDEFQDTDPVQWEIFSTLFEPDDDLVLIGDPKQAIYRFRGADVDTYVSARETALTLHSMPVNWRSDGRLVRATNLFFGGAHLGNGILHEDVAAPLHHQDDRLVFADGPRAPLQVRRLSMDVGQTAVPARDLVAHDLSGQVVELLEEVPTVVADDGSQRPLRAGDIAVLVRANAHSTLIRDALSARGIHSVINGVGSVFEQDGAKNWLDLLLALERPSHPARVKKVLLGPFHGWTPRKIAEASEDELASEHDRIHELARLLRGHGIARVWRELNRDGRVTARLLGQEGGERRAADLDHVAELLHRAGRSERMGTTALASWLNEQINEGAADDRDERARRLESDDDAVQILTIHRSKGLEFPVVLVPYLMQDIKIQRKALLLRDGDDLILDVSGDGDTDAARQASQHEAARMLYVALTRARHRTVVWWFPLKHSAVWRKAPISEVLLLRDANGERADVEFPKFTDEGVGERIDALVGRSSGLIDHVQVTTADGVVHATAPSTAASLAAATFERPLDTAWGRTSFSAISRTLEQPLVGSEPSATGWRDDEQDDAPSIVEPPDDEQPVPLSSLPAGAGTGTLIHAILEQTDFAADDLESELAETIRSVGGRTTGDVTNHSALLAGLRAAILTPLGPAHDERRLADLSRADRIDELGFELPLRGGLTPHGNALLLSELHALLDDQLETGDPLRPWLDRLAVRLSDDRPVRGYLTGAIDLFLRWSDDQPAFWFVDHKSNRLAPSDMPATAHTYRPAALANAMIEGDYVLQAILYGAAAHRYLRWRLAGYDPGTHLRGGSWLFVRGMTGPDVARTGGQPHGVFTWEPGGRVFAAVSDLLDSLEALA